MPLGEQACGDQHRSQFYFIHVGAMCAFQTCYIWGDVYVLFSGGCCPIGAFLADAEGQVYIFTSGPDCVCMMSSRKTPLRTHKIPRQHIVPSCVATAPGMYAWQWVLLLDLIKSAAHSSCAMQELHPRKSAQTDPASHLLTALLQMTLRGATQAIQQTGVMTLSVSLLWEHQACLRPSRVATPAALFADRVSL